MKILVHEWVTGGGLAGLPLPASLAEEGRAMRRAIADDFQNVEGTDVIMTLDERFAGEENPGRVVLVGKGREEATLSALASQCDDTVLIAPETGGVLADRETLLVRSGGRSLGSSPDAIALCADKRRLAEHLIRRGIRTPKTDCFDPSKGLPGSWDYPVVVKPIDGAGAIDTFLVAGPDRLPFEHPLPREMIVQPYLQGRPMSASFLVGRWGDIHLLGVGQQTIEIREGLIRYQGGRLGTHSGIDVEEPRRAVSTVAGLRGFVGVDFIWNDEAGSAHVIEINPRPTTSYVGLSRYHRPVTVARAWLSVVRGEPSTADVAPLLSQPSPKPVRFLPDGSVIVENGAIGDDHA